MGDSFMPHGMCYLWQTDLLLLHVISDGAIALAYFSIPLAIVYFVRRRHDLEYNWVPTLFAAFIVACGITHLLGIWVVWNPDYWADGMAKAATATISLVTAALLWPLLPKLLALPSPAQLQAANESLESEVARRIAAQTDLENLNRELERRIEQRTQELENSNRELERFAYHSSHDLKAPLRAIDQLSQWIAADLPEKPSGDLAENLNLMQSRIRRMQRMLDDLLDYARVGTDDDVELTEVDELISDVLDLASPPEKFSIEVDSSAAGVSLPRMPLQQVLLNLVSNAIRHHDRDDGRVEIGVSEAGSDLVFTVTDDGPGIAPEFHDSVFETFRTLARRDDSEASGIGLAIVKKAVERAGGSVSLRSAPGEGATFTVRWPKHV